jgi:hypothetical protein
MHTSAQRYTSDRIFIQVVFRFENKLNMLISENDRFRQEINADRLPLNFSYSIRPHQTNTMVFGGENYPTRLFLLKRATKILSLPKIS